MHGRHEWCLQHCSALNRVCCSAQTCREASRQSWWPRSCRPCSRQRSSSSSRCRSYVCSVQLECICRFVVTCPRAADHMQSHVVCRQPTYCGTVLPATHAQLRQRSACWCAADIELQMGKSAVGTHEIHPMACSSPEIVQDKHCCMSTGRHTCAQALSGKPRPWAEQPGMHTPTMSATGQVTGTATCTLDLLNGVDAQLSCMLCCSCLPDARCPKVSACCHRSAHRRQECGRQLQCTDGL